MSEDHERLLADLLAGDHRALARTISKIENRAPGYRDLVAPLYRHAGNATVIGVTGSPGAGKSTLVDKMAEAYRDRGETVGVVAIDPSSPFTGGAVLGDRIRMASNVGDMDVFVRSMSARGTLGGLATATADAVTAMDAFGKDRILVETVGAGQNEIDVVRTADTVAVLVPPGSGDSVQTLKAGILEIADVLVVNKADREGSDRTVRELREMIGLGTDDGIGRTGGHHGPESVERQDDAGRQTDGTGPDGHATWTPPVLETVATDGTGLAAFLEALDDHRAYLDASGERAEKARRRHAEEIRTLRREDVHDVLEAELARHGGVEELAEAIRTGGTDPYTIADDLLAPVRHCIDELDRESFESATR